MKLLGELNQDTTTIFSENVRAALTPVQDTSPRFRSPSTLILDLENVLSVDSAGLGCLLAMNRKVLEYQETTRPDYEPAHQPPPRPEVFSLCKPPMNLKLILNITRLEGVFAIFDTLDEALTAAKGDEVS